jgi:hypothetical protein
VRSAPMLCAGRGRRGQTGGSLCGARCGRTATRSKDSTLDLTDEVVSAAAASSAARKESTARKVKQARNCGIHSRVVARRLRQREAAREVTEAAAHSRMPVRVGLRRHTAEAMGLLLWEQGSQDLG